MRKYLCSLLFLLVPNLTLAAPKIKIGFILPLTGPVSGYGVAAKNGILLAKEERPDLFEDIDLVFDDSQYDPKTALSIFENFRTEKNISLVYVWGYSPSQAVAPVAEAKGVPIIAITSEETISSGKNNVIRFCYDLKQAANVLVRYSRRQNFHTIGIVKTDLAFHNTLIKEIENKLNATERLEVAENFGFDDQDFKTSILKLKSKSFDVLGVLLLEAQVSQFYRQATQLGYRPKTMLTDMMESPDEIARSGELINGAVFAAHYTSPEFIDRYRTRFSTAYQVPFAANSYEFVLNAARFAKGFTTVPTSKMWMDAFKSIKEKDSVLGKYSYDEKNNTFVVPVVLRQIQDGEIITIPE